MPLPVRVIPCQDETLISWFERLANAHGIGVGVLARHIGIDLTQPVFGETLTDTEQSGLAQATRTPPDHIAALTLARWNHDPIAGFAHDNVRAIPSAGWAAVRAWASHRSSRACPMCVEQRGVWSVHWRFAHSGVCAVHNVMLVDDCPQCGLPLRGGHTDKPWPPHPTVVPDPRVCDNVHPNAEPGRPRRCDHPIGSIATVTVPDRLADAQRVLELAAGRRIPLYLSGRSVSSGEFFRALRDVIALINCIADPDDLGDIPPVAFDAFWRFCELRDIEKGKGDAAPSYTVPPRSSAHAAAVLGTAVEMVRSPDLPEAVRWLVDRAVETERPYWRSLHQHLGCGPHVQNACGMNLRRFVSFAGMAAVTRPFIGTRLSAANVPQLCSPTVWDERFAPLLPGTAERNGRQMVSLSVVKAIGNCSWRLAAVALDIDAHRAGRCADWSTRHITDSETWWTNIWDHVGELPDGSRTLPDYLERRSRLVSLDRVPSDIWRSLCNEATVHPGRTDARRRNAAAWVWETVGGGMFESSPAMRAAKAAGARSDCLRDDYRRWLRWAGTSGALLDNLRAWADALVNIHTQQDIGEAV